MKNGKEMTVRMPKHLENVDFDAINKLPPDERNARLQELGICSMAQMRRIILQADSVPTKIVKN